MRNHVFLSYSFKDMHRARRLRDALRHYGLRVWPDDTLMPGAPSWQALAHERLVHAVCLIVVLTKDTVASYWAMKVIAEATAHGIPILPVVMDGDPGHRLLVDLDGDAWFDLRWGRNYASELPGLVATIDTLMDRPGVPITMNT